MWARATLTIGATRRGTAEVALRRLFLTLVDTSEGLIHFLPTHEDVSKEAAPHDHQQHLSIASRSITSRAVPSNAGGYIPLHADGDS